MYAHFELHGRNSRTRKEVESYIFVKFESSYGAEVQHFLPTILLIWEGVIRASYAGVKGGFGALSEVQRQKCYLKIPSK